MRMQSAGISRRALLKHAAAIGLAAATWPGVASALQESASPPHIILITADDLGVQLSCYGETNIQTPNLDRLAGEGVRFTKAYITQPSCSPSRSSLFTGLYPHQNGQIGLTGPWGFRLKEGVDVLPQVLKQNGYRTGLIGKQHVAPEDSFGWDMRINAFDDGVRSRPDTKFVQPIAKKAREFLAESDQPAFLKISYFDPHAGMVDQVAGLPEKILSPDDIHKDPNGEELTSQRKEHLAHWYNQVKRLDDGIGLLMDELRAGGLDRNTLILLLGDNGPALGRGKMTLYEFGTITPLIAWRPGVAQAGQTRSELVSSVDLVPTILEAAGLQPDTMRTEGRSLSPLLKGEPAPGDWRNIVFTEMTFHDGPILKPARAATDGRYKLIRNWSPPGDFDQFFDLQNDPLERKDLKDDASVAAHKKRLSDALDEWQIKTDDPLLHEGQLDKWREVWRKARERQEQEAATKPKPPATTQKSSSTTK